MTLMLLFIEGNENRFMLDEWFNRKIGNLPQEISDDILSQIIDNVDELPTKDAYPQKVCGVVKGDKPFFFELEYLNEEGYIPVLLDIEQIGLEEYLDSINRNNYFKNGTK